MTETPPFPKYDHYKDSGIPWLDQIPAHWAISSIRAVTELKSEKNQPDLPVLSVYREFGVILKDSRDDNHNVTSLNTSTYKAVRKGDFVVNKMKAWQGSMGVSEYEGIVSPAYITCRIKQDKMLPKYLHYLLRSKPFIGVYNSISYGVRVGQWDMHYEDFKKVAIVEPPNEEMARIVSFIDQKTTEIDAAIAKKQELIQLLNEQKAILINRAVTKGLNPNVKLKNSGVAWIGEIPEHWDVKKLKFATKIFRGKFTHRPRNDPQLYDGEYPFIQTGDVARAGMYLTEYKQTLNEKGLKVSTLIPKGTVVITIAANIGDISILNFDACFPDSIVGFEAQQLQRDFLYYALTSMKQQFLSSTVKNTQMNLNVDRIGNNFMPIPPENEQIEIQNWSNKFTAEIKGLFECLERDIEKLQEFKQVLITSATTGKIRV